MPILRIRTSNIHTDELIPTSIFNYPDSSILAFIMETLHLEITEPIRLYRKGEELWVVSSTYS